MTADADRARADVFPGFADRAPRTLGHSVRPNIEVIINGPRTGLDVSSHPKSRTQILRKRTGLP